jgi:anti-sigma28 factor (negative regulator of flagellin synthesis)
MRVNDNGFTERVATPQAAAPTAGNIAQHSSSDDSQIGASDNLQLSGFASRLDSGSSADASTRADRVSQLAKVINDKTFQINASGGSDALISEALRSKS